MKGETEEKREVDRLCVIEKKRNLDVVKISQLLPSPLDRGFCNTLTDNVAGSGL